MHQSDKELIHAYRGGDEGALAALIRRYLKVLYHLVRSIISDEDAVEDIVQDAIVKMWRHLAKYDDTQSFRAWLMRIAHNTAIDYLRKKRPQAFSLFETADPTESFSASIPDIEPRADEILMRIDDKKAVEDMLSVLSPLYREIVILRYYGDLTFEEIGIVTQKPLNTVKSQHRRGMYKLKLYLDGETDNGRDAPKRRAGS